MSLENVVAAAVREALAEMPRTFQTKDLSDVAVMQRAHHLHAEDAQYLPVLGRYLLRYSTRLGLTQIGPTGERGALWQRSPSAIREAAEQRAPAAPRAKAAGATKAARGGTAPAAPSGYLRVVEYMAGREFQSVKALFESYPEIGGVFLRPTETGVMALDLHPDSPKPRMGVGSDSYLAPGTTADAIRSGMPERIAALESARQQAKSHEGFRFEASLIREAQAHELRLPGFPERLRFLYDQARVGSGGDTVINVVAVDLATATLVSVALRPIGGAEGAASPYLQRIEQHREQYLPFFSRLAQVMGQLYGSTEMATLRAVTGTSASLVAWRDESGAVTVDGLERLATPTVSATGGARPAAAPAREEPRVGLGPQLPDDAPFQARMRLHQSWWRAEVLHLPYGTGPAKGNTTYFGNMLTEADGEKGANFLTPMIYRVLQRRLAEPGAGVEPFRLKRNMLSGQVMCFNLFAPLVGDPQLATRLLSAVLPGLVKEVLEVKLEYAPDPSREYLNDRTSFDAFVAFRRTDGADAFVGIETRLADAVAPAASDSPVYRRWTEVEDSPWPPGVYESLAAAAYSQLWHEQMLAVAVRRHARSPYEEGRLLLVYHPGDADTAAAVPGYRSLLKPGDENFAAITLDALVEAWSGASKAVETRAWLDAFHRRYLDLETSETAWERRA